MSNEKKGGFYENGNTPELGNSRPKEFTDEFN